jgi:threonine aldolase
MFWLEENHPAALVPGKRPRTTLSPTMALRDGEPYLCWGSPGGDQQDQWITQFFLRHVHAKLNLQEAIDAPAWHSEHFPISFWPRTARPGVLVVEGRLPPATVKELERRVAALAGKEAALFVPSGTMGNQIAVKCLTTPGEEVVLEAHSHINYFEQGGIAANSGCLAHPVETGRGMLAPEDLAAAMRADDDHVARVTLVCVENTHNWHGGTVAPLDRVRDLSAAARARGVRVHLDGARLWNAAVALGLPVSGLTRGASTVMVSFSKGLGCPVGSCLALGAGDRAVAWEIRRRLGGGMRQSGLLAAAALWALDHNLSRIGEDHEHAKLLAERLAVSPALRIAPPETNIVMIDFVREGDTAETVLPRLARAGVLLVPFGPRRLRAVTHLDVSRRDVERAADLIAHVLG